VLDDGFYELKHVVPRCVTLRCYVGRCISVVCDIKNTTGCIGIKEFKNTRHQVSRKSVRWEALCASTHTHLKMIIGHELKPLAAIKYNSVIRFWISVTIYTAVNAIIYIYIYIYIWDVWFCIAVYKYISIQNVHIYIYIYIYKQI
jgi:hypothetical protein